MNLKNEPIKPVTKCNVPHTSLLRQDDVDLEWDESKCLCSSPYLVPLTYRDLQQKRVGCTCLPPIQAVRKNNVCLPKIDKSKWTMANPSTTAYVSGMRDKVRAVLRENPRAVRLCEMAQAKKAEQNCLDYASRLKIANARNLARPKPSAMTNREITLKILRRLIVQMKRCGQWREEGDERKKCVADVCKQHLRRVAFAETGVEELKGSTECLQETPALEDCTVQCDNIKPLTSYERLQKLETINYLRYKNPIFDWEAL